MDDEGALLQRAAERFGREERISKALQTAKHAHDGQHRKTGEPFHNHVIAVALEAVGIDHPAVDVDTVIAALLHDVVEDTTMTNPDVVALYGVDVARIVEGVTDPRLGDTREERDEAFLAHVKRTGREDVRVLLVKLADQLDNTKTLEVHDPERRRELARQAILWYAPIANELGLPRVAERLEHQARKHL